MDVLAFVAFAGVHKQMRQPVLWLNPNGQIEVAGQPIKARMNVGANRIRLDGGYAYDFNGTRGGILIDDMPALALTGSMTVSAWMNLRQHVTHGPGAQILFRGDDRGGADPYTFVVHPDGTIHFTVQQENQQGAQVGGEVPLNQWIHVVGSFDAQTGELRLWLNHELVAYAKTTKRPFANLDKGWAPGLGIGNVQNEKGPHNQPFNGILADLRLYQGVYTPDDLDDGRSFWSIPPLARRATK